MKAFKTERKSKVPDVMIHHPINNFNFRKIDAMINLANNVGCNTLSFSPFKRRRNELTSLALSCDEEKELCLSLKKAKKKLNSMSMSHNIDSTLLRYKIGEEVWKKMPCYISWLHARIKVDGTVLPCNPCDVKMGNLKENKLSEIWNDQAFRKFRKRAISRKDLLSLNEECDCGFCCHATDNMRVHRLFRWISPFRDMKKYV